MYTPQSIFAHPIMDDPEKLLSLDEAKEMLDHVLKLSPSSGSWGIQVGSWWGYSQRWARNRKLMATDQRSGFMTILGFTSSNVSVENVVPITQFIDHYKNYGRRDRPLDMKAQLPDREGMGRVSLSNSTLNPTKERFQSVAAKTISNAKAGGFITAGDLECIASSGYSFFRDNWGRLQTDWIECTQARISVSFRNEKTSASGWVGKTSYDIDALDLESIARRSHEICIRSADPIRMEPGRYPTILSPQVTGDLMKILIRSLNRAASEVVGALHYSGYDPLVNRFKGRIGLKIVDERISVSHDPTDPLLGTPKGDFARPISWIKNGMLVGMNEQESYALSELVNSKPNIYRESFKIDGTDTGLEDIISNTERGLLLNRVFDVRTIHLGSLLQSGFTRDGLWLIEKGKITKSVRNFRFSESPLFIFNNVINIGKSEPIYSPVFTRPLYRYGNVSALSNISAPYMHVNDFSFVATIDAI